MVKQITTCDFEDLLSFAESLGFTWNRAHDLLVKANMHIGYLSSDHYKTAYCAEAEHVDARAILKNFMEKHGVSELYITPKHYPA